MISEYINAILLGFGLAFMVGPVFFTLIETSITKGVRAALTFDLGVCIAGTAAVGRHDEGAVADWVPAVDITSHPYCLWFVYHFLQKNQEDHNR